MNLVICRKIDGTADHVKQNKSDSEGQILHVFSHIWTLSLKETHAGAGGSHTCNPIYPGGRDQEDRGLRPAQANSSGDTILKIPNTVYGHTT
jgi:hypothetical protein